LLWLKAMLEKEADVGDILERIQENVPAEVWQTDTFAQQLTHSFFKFVSVSTNSLSENEKVLPLASLPASMPSDTCTVSVD